MKDYMVTRTLKSEEVRGQYFEIMKDIDADSIRSRIKNENTSFRMNWYAGEGNMVMYRW